jgi:predicted amidohydrolase YtcJ
MNSSAVEELGLDRGADTAGVERDESGRATGRLFGLDDWLRERLESAQPPSLEEVSRHLARFGVTGLTDATPGTSSAEMCAFEAAVGRGELLQRLIVMGNLDLPVPVQPSIERGAVKVRLDESDLPRFEELEQKIKEAHRENRPVAFHCVTRAELVLASTALAAAGPRVGDRIEHASVAPPDAVSLLADLPVTVVTQPHFIYERGDAYLRSVESRDLPWLYRCRGFLDASIPLGAGTDAPFGDPDPWRAIRAAVERRTEAGVTLGPDERLDPERALALFTSAPHAPGAPPRRIELGAPADLCLLDRPWHRARSELSSLLVAATIRGGSILWAESGREESDLDQRARLRPTRD